MSIEQLRFSGGAMHGKVVWMERQHLTLDVHVGGQAKGASKTLHYRRSGALLCYMGESQTGAAVPDAIRPPDGAGPAAAR